MRQHGHFGAKPRNYKKAALTFENYLTTRQDILAPAGIIDLTENVESWPMYLNDEYGDCTIAGMGHAFQAMTAALGTSNGVQFSDDVIKSTYFTLSPNDDGCELLDVCKYMTSTGMADVTGRVHKLAAYSEIESYWRLETLKSALYLTGTVYIALCLPDNAMQAFDNEEPWTDTNEPADPNNGHCVVIELSAVGDPSVIDDETLITWGAKEKVSMAWLRKYIVEAICVVSEDYVNALSGTNPAGFNLQMMIADAQSLAT
jgi:hypothetical protein